MLEVQTTPAQRRPSGDHAPALSGICRFFCERTAALRRLAAALAAGAVFAGCVVPPDPDADPGISAAEDVMEGVWAQSKAGPGAAAGPEPAPFDDSEPPRKVPCVAGTWITLPRACDCPRAGDDDFTLECLATDCFEAELLLMRPSGAALLGSIRYSAGWGMLSAVGGEPAEGTWYYHDDGELRLEIEGNVLYTPTECEGDQLQMKAHPLMISAPPALDAAIFWAWLLGAWTVAPYSP